MWIWQDEEIFLWEDVDVASAMTQESVFDSLPVQQDANTRLSIDKSPQESTTSPVIIGKYLFVCLDQECLIRAQNNY